MARTEDVAMKNYRRIRRKMNARLAKAEREGRLEKELEAIEHKALNWWESVEAPKKVHRAAAR